MSGIAIMGIVIGVAVPVFVATVVLLATLGPPLVHAAAAAFNTGSGFWRVNDRREARRDERRRFDMPRHRREGGPVYRSRCGMIFGVCRGVAEYLGFSVFWFRFLTVCAALFTGVWPVIGVYILAALLMKPEPVVPFEEDSEREFYDSYVNSRTMALSRLKRTFDNLERRIRRMENLVTAREYDWERRLNDRG